jgi:hypothetical protein
MSSAAKPGQVPGAGAQHGGAAQVGHQLVDQCLVVRAIRRMVRRAYEPQEIARAAFVPHQRPQRVLKAVGAQKVGVHDVARHLAHADVLVVQHDLSHGHLRQGGHAQILADVMILVLAQFLGVQAHLALVVHAIEYLGIDGVQREVVEHSGVHQSAQGIETVIPALRGQHAVVQKSGDAADGFFPHTGILVTVVPITPSMVALLGSHGSARATAQTLRGA